MINLLLKRNYEARSEVIAAGYIERTTQRSALIGGFDALALIITDGSLPTGCHIHHYSKDGIDIQERWYSREVLHALLGPDGNADVQYWVRTAEISFDKEGFLASHQSSLQKLSKEQRKQKLLSEFALFLRHYWLSKNYLADGYELDAYSQILTALHYWARLSVIQQGHTLDTPIWKQVRTVNPGVFKLYEEMVSDTETLLQRIQLAHLACDFLLTSKIKEYCEPLINIMRRREEPWSIAELASLPELKSILPEINLILKKLVRKSIVQEVLEANDPDLDILEMKYSLT